MSLPPGYPTKKPRYAKCAGCGKSILWVVNENGKKEPFDARQARVLAEAQNPTYGMTIVMAHLPHFVTCPKAGEFKRGGA